MKPLLKKPILLFLIITLVLSAILYCLILVPGITVGNRQGFLFLALKWCPALATLITSLVCYRSLKNLGWGLGKPKCLLWVYFAPLVYGGLVYGLVWAFRLGDFNLEMGAAMLTGGGLLGLLMMAVVGLGLPTLGEEIGWRGLLAPELAKDFDFIDVSLYSGIITLIWYTPLILTGNGVTNAPLWYNWLCYACLTIGMSFAYTWLRMKSNSLWVPFFLHAGHNFIIGILFDGLMVNNGITFYLTTELGAGLALAGVVIGLFFWRLGAPVKSAQDITA